MIGLGKENNGLYLLQASIHPLSLAALATNVSHISSSDLWHSRLGHPSLTKLQLLKQFVVLILLISHLAMMFAILQSRKCYLFPLVLM